MIYVIISLMAVFILYKFIAFVRNKNNARSMDKMDASLVKTINKQAVNK
jgi:hypothetical protein